jgi:two-component system nitrate/nitrite response regulator NarL
MTGKPNLTAPFPLNLSGMAPNPAQNSAPLRTVIQPESQTSKSSPASVGKKTIRLLLADDHPVVRKGIGSCLSRHHGLQIVAEASDGVEAVRKARETSPDIVVTDIDMPRMNGLALAETLRREMPQIKVLVLSMYSNSEYVLRIIRSGARGYVLKEASPEELIQAIETINAGEAFFSSDVARVALNLMVHGAGETADANQLTQRENEVLVQIAEGASNKEIANSLGVSVRTVETHRERIMRKLNIHSVAGLTKYSITKGLIPLRREPEA